MPFSSAPFYHDRQQKKIQHNSRQRSNLSLTPTWNKIHPKSKENIQPFTNREPQAQICQSWFSSQLQTLKFNWKILFLFYKTINYQASTYISGVLAPYTLILRISDQGLLVIPHLKTSEDCVFAGLSPDPVFFRTAITSECQSFCLFFFPTGSWTFNCITCLKCSLPVSLYFMENTF